MLEVNFRLFLSFAKTEKRSFGVDFGLRLIDLALKISCFPLTDFVFEGKHLEAIYSSFLICFWYVFS